MVQAPLAWNPQRSRIDHPPQVFWAPSQLTARWTFINNGTVIRRCQAYITLLRVIPRVVNFYLCQQSKHMQRSCSRAFMQINLLIVPRVCNSAMIRGELEPAQWKVGHRAPHSSTHPQCLGANFPSRWTSRKSTSMSPWFSNCTWPAGWIGKIFSMICIANSVLGV